MKKIVTGFLTLVLCLSVGCPVFAADFVESIGYKPAPEIVPINDEEDIIGYIIDDEGTQISVEHGKCIVITPVSKADSSQEIPAKEKETLLKEYDEFATGKKKLSDVKGLDEAAKKVMGEDKTADDFVIRDFFDASIICADKEKLEKEGTTLDLTFNIGVAKNTPVVAMVFVDGEWKLVENAVNNGDGTITCTFEKLCPVAFLVPGETIQPGASTTPTTGDNANIVVWSAVAAISLGLIIALVIIYRSKKNK